jgi:hypothetical protein
MISHKALDVNNLLSAENLIYKANNILVEKCKNYVLCYWYEDFEP